jgi:hypothetical protein
MSEIQNITDRHRAIMRDMVLAGLTSVEISQKYEISQTHVSTLINSPLWKTESASMHDSLINDYKGKMVTMIPKALKNVDEIMERESVFDIIDPKTGESREAHVINPPASRLKASEMVLNAAGMVGKDNGNSGSKSILLQLVQPGWGSDDGKPAVLNVQINQ